MTQKRTVQAFILFAVLSSIVHYTDNTIRFDRYPQNDPKLIARPLVPISWVVFTVFAYLGYRWYLEGRLHRAGAALAFYAVSGLISPLHYTSAPMSDFDALQNTFILTDFLAGALVFAVALRLLSTPKEAWQTSR